MLVQINSHYSSVHQRPYRLSTSDRGSRSEAFPLSVSEPPARDEAAPVSRILIVDDHPVFRSALESLVRAICPSKPTIAVGSLLELADAVASDTEFDCVFLDLELPDSQGLRTFQQAKSLLPDTPIVVVSGHGSQLVRNQCLKAGAVRFIGKTIQHDALILSLQQILTDKPGRRTVEHQMVEQQSAKAKPTRKVRPVLSGRQFETLTLIAEGCSNNEIAKRLNIKYGTVKSHVSRLLNSLGVRSRQEAAALLNSMGRESDREGNDEKD